MGLSDQKWKDTFEFHVNVRGQKSIGDNLSMLRKPLAANARSSHFCLVAGQVSRHIVESNGFSMFLHNIQNCGLSNLDTNLVTTALDTDIECTTHFGDQSGVFAAGDFNFI